MRHLVEDIIDTILITPEKPIKPLRIGTLEVIKQYL